jgi:hypothetical protein
MKRKWSLLLVTCCACFSSIAGCSQIHSSEQAGRDSATQPNQTPVTSTTPATTTSEHSGGTLNSGSEVADEVHTPPKGSEERQAIMDALREEFNNHRSIYYQPHRGGIAFVVNRLRVHDGWAWTFANPQSTDAGDRFGEYNGFLLQLADGRWAVMKLPAMVNDPDDPENLDYPTAKDIARIKKLHPTMPTDIFAK